MNGLRPSLFVEPFAGGASASLQLLADDAVESVGIADLDPLVASFWECVFYDSDWLINAVSELPVSLATWQRMRAERPEDARGRALKCLYLNRTSFSGILAPSAGPIGGQAQRSAYDIGCRFNIQTIVRRLTAIRKLREKVRFVWQCDWATCLTRLRTRAEVQEPDRVFLYLDPPFYEKADRLYSFYFKREDHRTLHDGIVNLPYRWLLSYDAAIAIEQLYAPNGSRPRRIETIYSVAGPTGFVPAQELIITNLDRLPDVAEHGQAAKKERS